MSNRQNLTTFLSCFILPHLKSYVVAVALCCAVSLPAQTNNFALIIGNEMVAPGDQICVPVTTQGFNCIVDFQFALAWDPQVLSFQGLHQQNLSAYGSIAHNEDQVTGLSKILWYDTTAVSAGATLADGTSIFEICFTAVGAAGSQSPVAFSTAGFPVGSNFLEAVNCFSNNLWTATSGVNGSVAITDGPFFVSTSTVGDEPTLQIAPNPFSAQTQLTFKLSKAGSVQVKVMDAAGKLVFDEKRPGLAGENKLDVSGEGLPAGGYYQVVVQTQERQFTGSVFYVKK